MITAEIKVNGCLIAHLYCVNVCNCDLGPPVEEGNEHACLYEWSYHKMTGGETIKGEVTHHRKDGAEELIQLIWEKMA